MTTSSVAAFPLQYNNVQTVKFAAVQDSDAGDENIEPPYVRVRQQNSSWLYVDADRKTQLNPDSNTAQWVVGQGAPDEPNHMAARKIKRFCLSYNNMTWNTPCVNAANNVLEFRLGSDVNKVYTAIIPTYNYRSLSVGSACDGNNDPFFPIPNPPAPTGWADGIDAYDGILDKICGAINRALITNPVPSPIRVTFDINEGYRTFSRSIPFYNDPSNLNPPATPGIFQYNYVLRPTQCKFWTLRVAGAADTICFTGGSMMEKGLRTIGITPLPKLFSPTDLQWYANTIRGGPVTYMYTRWLDILSNTLTGNSKMNAQGTNVNSTLIERVYLSPSTGGELGMIGYSNSGPTNQFINWRKDQLITSVDLTIRDEYGTLLEVPNRTCNNGWFSMIFNCQL